MTCSAEESGTTRFNGLDFLQLDGKTAETSRQVGYVEKDTLGGVNRAKLRAGRVSDASIGATNRPLKRPVLLSMISVRAEGGVPCDR